jgi:hypothetical protein
VSLSSDGRTVAIGAQGNDGNGCKSGHVRVYKLNISDHRTQVGIDIDGKADFDVTGASESYVSFSSDGRTVAVGAYQNDGNGSNSWSCTCLRLVMFQLNESRLSLGLHYGSKVTRVLWCFMASLLHHYTYTHSYIYTNI